MHNRAWALLRVPSPAPGRRYSYHRAILLAGAAAALFLFRPATPSVEAVALDRWVATAAFLLASAGFASGSGRAWLRRRATHTATHE